LWFATACGDGATKRCSTRTRAFDVSPPFRKAVIDA
jgi:hypothetical protein